MQLYFPASCHARFNRPPASTAPVLDVVCLGSLNAWSLISHIMHSSPRQNSTKSTYKSRFQILVTKLLTTVNYLWSAVSSSSDWQVPLEIGVLLLSGQNKPIHSASVKPFVLGFGCLQWFWLVPDRAAKAGQWSLPFVSSDCSCALGLCLSEETASARQPCMIRLVFVTGGFFCVWM